MPAVHQLVDSHCRCALQEQSCEEALNKGLQLLSGRYAIHEQIVKGFACARKAMACTARIHFSFFLLSSINLMVLHIEEEDNIYAIFEATLLLSYLRVPPGRCFRNSKDGLHLPSIPCSCLCMYICLMPIYGSHRSHT